MRLSDLLGARVCEADGTYVGNVSDVRMVQDGPVLGTWGAAFGVEALIVSRNNTGSFLGYERGSLQGPWLVATVVRWLHRHAVLVPWSDVASVGDHAIRLAGSAERRNATRPPASRSGASE